ncbi:16S rRNA (guanine(966)-N(2))-methyltransferase RsmD [Alteromonas gilva]|uniref:Ribosomal RNA small subunit methyltransferase D n=1 Tax=Alteromonas gilva TaxID=2987522 RepID=A0ABT5KYV6_9ALTE|nr:16S rRNA (guanine(966)-N(2))-methyltransferase RsmD [Alteromonas gilva]MDC8829950.1 16S rRNA (guanine(966)-N(2))-methyltransferase RsmD [Alteromonas gilva]
MNRVAKHKRRPARPTGSVRLISGQWRGRRLPVLDAEGLRPSTDRTRETLFNWLMADTQGSNVLDVFAGSGVLGLEALSRYANSAVFIEMQSGTARQLEQNLATLNARADVHCGNALTILPTLGKQFDIVFIDPPFGQDLVNSTLTLLHAHQLLADNAKIYIEQEVNGPAIVLPPGCHMSKQKQAGQLTYCLLGYAE